MSFDINDEFNKHLIKKRKETITCDCGITVKVYNYSAHKLSNAHIEKLRKIKSDNMNKKISLEDRLKLKIEIIEYRT